jgi:hypothetical protein
MKWRQFLAGQTDPMELMAEVKRNGFAVDMDQDERNDLADVMGNMAYKDVYRMLEANEHQALFILSHAWEPKAIIDLYIGWRKYVSWEQHDSIVGELNKLVDHMRGELSQITREAEANIKNVAQELLARDAEITRLKAKLYDLIEGGN